MKEKIFIILLFICLIACSNSRKNPGNEVICPTEPSSGLVKLETKKILTIDSLSIDENKPPIISFLLQDDQGNIFMGCNNPEMRIYKFSNRGELLKQFLIKGEGPGELLSLHFMQYVDNSIWAGSKNKIIRFDMDGNFLSEKRLKRQYRQVVIIDSNRFIAVHVKIEKNASGKEIQKSMCSMVNLSDEADIFTLIDEGREDLGYTLIKQGDFVMNLSLSGITPDYITVYNFHNQSIYQCVTDEPIIYMREVTGETKKIIRRDYFKRRVLNESDKDMIMAMFRGFDEEMKTITRKNLPQRMLAISSIKLLPNNHVAVYFYKNLNDYEICIFNQMGIFKYIIEFPLEPSWRSCIFTKNGYGVIERKDDRDLYVEYKVINLPDIFVVGP